MSARASIIARCKSLEEALGYAAIDVAWAAERKTPESLGGDRGTSIFAQNASSSDLSSGRSYYLGASHI
jgi:hypothetical protein